VQDILKSLNRHNKFFYAVIALLIVARILIGFNLHYWLYSGAMSDDGWMISNAQLAVHFSTSNQGALIKDMGYPILLALNGVSGVPYSLSLTLLWIVMATMGLLFMKKITKNQVALVAVFAFLLFFPSAFETNVGTKIYRNSILVPLIFMLVFALLNLVFLFIVDRHKKRKAILGWSVMLGVILLMNFYIKEDGLWMLLLTVSILALLVLYVLACEIRVSLTKNHATRIVRLSRKVAKNIMKKMNWKRVVTMAAILLVPIVIFEGGTFAYKKIDQHYFGVAEINTRTEGQYGTFIQQIYKVKAEGRSDVVWAPWDAVKEVFAVSPTLRSVPNLEYDILNSPWVPKGVKNSGMVHDGMIGGDFMTWAFRDAYVQATKRPWNDREAESFFAKVNAEVATAFHDGRLQKANLIQISSSMGGYTFAQMFGIANIELAGLRNDMLFYGYQYDATVGDCSNQPICDIANKKLNMNIASSGGKMHIYQVANAIIAMYQKVNLIAVPLAMVGILAEIILIVRKKSTRQNSIVAAVAVVLLLGGGAVVFAISWFVNFIYLDNDGHGSAILYYAVEATPLLVMAQILGLYLFFTHAGALMRARHRNKTSRPV